VHFDVKPQNIIVDPRGDMKMTDFGFSRPLDATTRTAVPGGFTPTYAAPEVLAYEYDPSVQIDARADTWPLAMMLFEIYNPGRRLPFADATSEGELHDLHFSYAEWHDKVVVRYVAPSGKYVDRADLAAIDPHDGIWGATFAPMKVAHPAVTRHLLSKFAHPEPEARVPAEVFAEIMAKREDTVRRKALERDTGAALLAALEISWLQYAAPDANAENIFRGIETYRTSVLPLLNPRKI
jgi:serine/threonine protein kinase